MAQIKPSEMSNATVLAFQAKLGINAASKSNIPAVFDNLFGTWIGSVSSPITTPITLDFTNALSSGTCAIYYQAATLEITDTYNQIRIQSDDQFVSDEICIVWMIYDLSNNAVIVNVQSGYIPGTPITSTTTTTSTSPSSSTSTTTTDICNINYTIDSINEDITTTTTTTII